MASFTIASPVSSEWAYQIGLALTHGGWAHGVLCVQAADSDPLVAAGLEEVKKTRLRSDLGDGRVGTLPLFLAPRADGGALRLPVHPAARREEVLPALIGGVADAWSDAMSGTVSGTAIVALIWGRWGESWAMPITDFVERVWRTSGVSFPNDTVIQATVDVIEQLFLVGISATLLVGVSVPTDIDENEIPIVRLIVGPRPAWVGSMTAAPAAAQETAAPSASSAATPNAIDASAAMSSNESIMEQLASLDFERPEDVIGTHEAIMRSLAALDHDPEEPEASGEQKAQAVLVGTFGPDDGTPTETPDAKSALLSALAARLSAKAAWQVAAAKARAKQAAITRAAVRAAAGSVSIGPWPPVSPGAPLDLAVIWAGLGDRPPSDDTVKAFGQQSMERAAAFLSAASIDLRGAAIPDNGLLTSGWSPRPEPPVAGETAVVVAALGNVGTGKDKDIVDAFKDIVGVALPIPPVPNLATVRRTLLAEFPWVKDIIDPILNDLVGRRGIAFRPILLVGRAGCGKTAFAERLTALLGLASLTYSCGGVADSAIAGCSRRWNSGEPSLPMSQIRRWKTAAPAIVLDEIEKVGSSRHNGNVLDALLGMLEPQSSTHWHDPYIEAEIDISHVVWLATANVLDDLPGPIRDRFRIFSFPEPRREHLEAVAPRILERALSARGLRGVWATPIDPIEMEALRRHWAGGSLRGLTRMVEAVVEARGRNAMPH